jgi:hypothetical protein
VEAYGEVEAYLRRRVPELLGEAIRSIMPIASGVWRLDLHQSVRVAKYHLFAPLTRNRSYDVLQVERDVLNALSAAGCRVPRVVALDEEAYFAFYEWVGESTLDDWAQENRRRDGALLCGLLRDQQAIDSALADGSARWAQRVAPGGGKEEAHSGWHAACQRALVGAEALLRHLQRPALTERVRRGLEALERTMAERPLVLGSSDYNARNIVVSPQGTAFFIEFSKLSWDWTERRLVQYTTCMGSARAGGTMRPLLDRDAVDYYVERIGDVRVARAMDAHQIVFLLNAAAMLCSALSRPDEQANGALLRAWKNPARRLQTLACTLATPLSNDVDARCVRAAFSPV